MTVATLPPTARIQVIRDALIRERSMRERVFANNFQKRREKVGEMATCLEHLAELEKHIRAES